jgi:hypothetical protein
MGNDLTCIRFIGNGDMKMVFKFVFFACQAQEGKDEESDKDSGKQEY